MSTSTEWSNKETKLCPVLQDMLKEASPSRQNGFFSKSLAMFKDALTPKIRVIVKLDAKHYARTLNNDNLGGVLGCQIQHRLESVDGFSASVSRAELNRLVGHNAVVKVWSDRQVKAAMNVAARAVNVVSVWQNRLQGKGIGIAILDTGIYPHPDLTYPKNRIIAFKDFVNGKSKAYDDNGHGTHCAGCAAGNGYRSKKKYRGIAPKANLIGVKVLDRRGSGYMSNIMAGVEWCVANRKKYGIQVISLSLGTQAVESYKDDPMCAAAEKAWKSGLIVCVAAGNEGPEAKTVNTPGIDPRVITVGAVDDHNTVERKDDAIAGFSSRGPTLDGLTKPDLVTPGVEIISLRSPGAFLDQRFPKFRVGQSYFRSSGTSMATPICAGAAALLLEARPGIEPSAVKNALLATCHTIVLDANAQGAGLTDIRNAIRFARFHM